jgi:hypothetical protein
MPNPLVEAFKEKPIWVSWKPITRHGKTTKLPYDIWGDLASSTNPETWSTYNEIKNFSDNVGIVLTPDEPMLGIDIDDCIKAGEIVHEFKDQIEQLIKKADSYTEISPSGTGIHIYIRLTEYLNLIANRHGSFESYTSGRYFTVTEKSYGEAKGVRTITPDKALELLEVIGYPWKKKEKSIDKQAILPSIQQPKVYNPIDDFDLIEKMFKAKNGSKLKALYDGDTSEYEKNDSNADMALCSHLAFWTGKDALQMERLWLASPLGAREKTQTRKDYRDRTISAAIINCTDVYNSFDKNSNNDESNGVTRNGKPTAERLVKIVTSNPHVSFFHDEYGIAYSHLKVEDHMEIWPCHSRRFELWISAIFRKEFGEIPSINSIATAMNIIEGIAIFEGKEIKLHNRIAYVDESIMYDLANDDWSAVRITKEGYSVVKDVPILFRRYGHLSPQTKPEGGGDVNEILKFVNITDSEQQLLFLVHLISYFIPGFPHPVMYVYGPQGSAKSTISLIARKLIDPSKLDVLSMPGSIDELVLHLSHHYLVFYDNVSYISPEISDLSCRAVTGSGFSKRKLYTNDEDIIINILANIGVNGINLSAIQPDLLERCLLFELNSIKKGNRKEANKMNQEFELAKPKILGAIFSIISKALNLKSSINVARLPRMADFTLWGCAIAEALGYSKEVFLKAYNSNIASQNEEALEGNIVATLIMTLMDNIEKWSGTADELLTELKFIAQDDRFDYRSFPNSPGSLSRKINTLKPTLEVVGIYIIKSKGSKRRIITIIKKNDKDDNDDIL